MPTTVDCTAIQTPIESCVAQVFNDFSISVDHVVIKSNFDQDGNTIVVIDVVLDITIDTIADIAPQPMTILSRYVRANLLSMGIEDWPHISFVSNQDKGAYPN